MHHSEHSLTQRGIFWFWVPLAAMWLLMAVEQPAMTAVIARLDQAEIELAAFGIMFAVALAVESPILQLLAAGTALSYDRRHYDRLMRFTHVLALSLSGLHLLLAATPLYALILQHVIRAPTEVIGPSRAAFLLATPFTAAVAYRRLWQGVLIRFGHTKVIPVTMVVRFAAMGAVLLVGYRTRALPGAALAGLALSVGVIAAAVASWVFVRRVVSDEMPAQSPHRDHVATGSWAHLLRFYLPLSLTSVVYLMAQPLVTVGIARAPYPLQSLAVWPVIKAYLFLFASLALSLQEVALALLARRNSARELRRFTIKLGLGLSALFLAFALTPANQWWYTTVAGLTPRLAPFTQRPTLLLSLVPFLLTLKSWFRARHIYSRDTMAIGKAVVLYSGILFVAVVGGAYLLPVPGAVTGAIAVTLAAVAEISYLQYNARRGSLRLKEAVS